MYDIVCIEVFGMPVFMWLCLVAMFILLIDKPKGE